MPEMLEVEVYRRAAAAAVGRPIVAVDAPDAWFLKGGATAEQVVDALVGRRFVADRRRGKLLLLDTSDDGPTLGLRFGMTGVLELDGVDAIDQLQYALASVAPDLRPRLASMAMLMRPKSAWSSSLARMSMVT